MVQKIEQDSQRFRQIIRGKIKQDVKRFLTNSELIGKKGKELVTIPIPQLEIPRFIYGEKQRGGVGQGQGDVGTPLGPGPEGSDPKAGDAPGEHMLEVELSFEELADIIGEGLELPKIEPRGHADLESVRRRYTGIAHAGPEGLKHFKRTYRQALRRQLLTGQYDPKKPMVIPVREDRRYRTYREIPQPHHKAVVFFMLDVSGSMGSEQKEIVRLETFWIDTWLRKQYASVEVHYIIHDAVAREVDRETFFHTRESGGTIISSAYKLCLDLINRQFAPTDWNIYPFHFSDGDNWSSNDTEECMKLLEMEFFPIVNLFCYGQVESEYGSGQFMRDLTARFPSHDRLITSRIENKDAIPRSIKDFLGKGK
ncbi:MAG: DUF444 family protein [Deltaproteobacteria bacterium]|nr:DUF444 family protein [Deltaproteobacteria bacterium]